MSCIFTYKLNILFRFGGFISLSSSLIYWVARVIQIIPVSRPFIFGARVLSKHRRVLLKAQLLTHPVLRRKSNELKVFNQVP
jgi:hypothetical protein